VEILLSGAFSFPKKVDTPVERLLPSIIAVSFIDMGDIPHIAAEMDPLWAPVPICI
jgi:hypothetical protein